MRVGNSKTALFLGAVGRKILVPFFLVRKVRRRLLGFGVPPPPPLSFHPQELSWHPREQGGKGELGVTAGSKPSPGFGWITEDAAQDSEIKPGNSCGNLDSNHGVTAPPPS